MAPRGPSRAPGRRNRCLYRAFPPVRAIAPEPDLAEPTGQPASMRKYAAINRSNLAPLSRPPVEENVVLRGLSEYLSSTSNSCPRAPDLLRRRRPEACKGCPLSTENRLSACGHSNLLTDNSICTLRNPRILPNLSNRSKLDVCLGVEPPGWTIRGIAARSSAVGCRRSVLAGWCRGGLGGGGRRGVLGDRGRAHRESGGVRAAIRAAQRCVRLDKPDAVRDVFNSSPSNTCGKCSDRYIRRDLCKDLFSGGKGGSREHRICETGKGAL